MVDVKDAEISKLITQLAIELKSVPEIKAPEWAGHVKTGVHKERPPVDPEWWHTRAAAVLRTVYDKGPVGVSKLRTKYGGAKNRGVKTEHHYKGSGSIARKILQQLEKAGLVEQAQRGSYKGRVVTGKAHSLLIKAAKTIK